MKKNSIRLIVLLFCFTLSFSLFAQDKKADPVALAGEWAFNVSDAPYGYEKGTAKLFVEEGKLKGEFKLGGAVMKVNTFTAKGNDYSCTVYVDGYPVDVTLTQKDNQLSGKADDGSQVYNVSLKRIE